MEPGRDLQSQRRYGQMTMALIAQAAMDGLRERLAPSTASWMRSTWPKLISWGWKGAYRSTEIQS